MSVFSKILERYNLSKHDGRPLWQYRCTPEEYQSLKESIKIQLRFSSEDSISIDAALFAAEWWRNEYSGGSPAWEDIVCALGNDPLKYKDIYRDACIQGGNRLGINWIVFSNTHFLRTLLVQGGLPLKRISQHLGRFSSLLEFVIKKIDLYGGEQIDVEWLKNTQHINSLPLSFKNSVIYELVIQTARAIWQEDDNALPFDISHDISVQKMVSELKESRKNRKHDSGAGLKIKWELELKENTAKLYYSAQSDKSLSENFLIRNQIPTNTSEMYIFLTRKEIAFYRYNAAEELLRYSSKNIRLLWNENESFVECNATIDNNKEVELIIPGQSTPDLTLPQLMSKQNDALYQFTGTTVTGFASATLLIPENWTIPSNNAISTRSQTSITIQNKLFKLIDFEGSIDAVYQNETLSFQTNCNTPDDCVVYDQPKPAWVLHSSKEVFAGDITFRQFGEGIPSKKIDNRNIFWRMSSTGDWISLEKSKPGLGNVMFHVKSAGSSYFYRGYYLKDTVIDSIPLGPRIGKIEIRNFNGVANVLNDVDVEQCRNNNSLTLTVSAKTGDEPPGRVQIRLDAQGKGSLTIDIVPPFKGAYFTDPEGKILKRKTRLCVDSLLGCRLICLGDDYRLFIKPVGEFSDFSSTMQLQQGSHPLYKYENAIKDMLNLYNPVHENGFVELSLLNNGGGIEAMITVAHYNCFTTNDIPFKLTDLDEKVIEKDIILHGFHLGDLVEKVENVPLAFTQGGEYCFAPATTPGLWIVYTKSAQQFHLRPTLKVNQAIVDYKVESELANVNKIENRTERIIKIREILQREKYDSTVWKEIVIYYKLLVNHGLPAAAIDYYYVIAANPTLSVRFFIASQFQFSTDNEMLNALLLLENSLPFAWHLIPVKCWSEGCYELTELPGIMFHKIIERLKFFLNELFLNSEEYQPGHLLFSFANDLQKQDVDPGPIPKSIIDDLRTHMKEPENWPQKWYPSIPDEYRQLFDVSKFENYQWPMLLAPLRAALIVAGKKHGYLSNPEKQKRMQLYRRKSQKWYDYAFAHMLQRIIASERKN